MNIFKKSAVVKIEQDDINDAKLSSIDFSDDITKKRAFINVLGARLAMKMLFSDKIEANNVYSLYTIHNLLKELDIADIYFKGIKIDVRLVFDRNEIFIPKSHFKYNLLPDLYLILELKEDLSSVELLGFFEPQTLNKANANKDFYFYEYDRLNDPKELKSFLNKFRTQTPLTTSEANTKKAESLFLSLADDEISQKDKLFLFKQLANDLSLREKMVEFENFEILSKEVAKTQPVLVDKVLDIVGAQELFEENDEDISEEDFAAIFEEESEEEDITATPHSGAFESISDEVYLGENADAEIMEEEPEQESKGLDVGTLATGLAIGGAVGGVIGAAASAAAIESNIVAGGVEAISAGLELGSDLINNNKEENEFLNDEIPDFESLKETTTEEPQAVETLDDEEITLEKVIQATSIDEIPDFEFTEELENEQDSIEEASELINETIQPENDLNETETDSELDLINEIEQMLQEEETEKPEISIPEETINEVSDDEFTTPDKGEDDSEEPISTKIDDKAKGEEIETLGLLEAPADILFELPELDGLEPLESLEEKEEKQPEVKEETYSLENFDLSVLSESVKEEEEEIIPEYLSMLGSEAEGIEATFNFPKDELEEEIIPAYLSTPTTEEEYIENDLIADETTLSADISQEEPIESFEKFSEEMPEASFDEPLKEKVEPTYEQIEEPFKAAVEEKAEPIKEIVQTDINSLDALIDGDSDDFISQMDAFLNELESSEDKKKLLQESLPLEDLEVPQPVETPQNIATQYQQIDTNEMFDSNSTEVAETEKGRDEFKEDVEALMNNAENIDDIDLFQLRLKEEKIDNLPEAPIKHKGEISEIFKKKKMIIAASVAGVVLVSFVIGANIANNNSNANESLLKTMPISAENPAGTMPAENTISSEMNQQDLNQANSPMIAQESIPNDQQGLQNRDMGQAVSDAFLSEPVNATISKIAWEVPEDLAYNDSFRKYLQMAGKNLKLNLQNDLLLATEMAYSNKVVVDLEITKDSILQSETIAVSSGSKQIDKIVLQSVKETLKYLKLPASEVNGNSINATLIINF